MRAITIEGVSKRFGKQLVLRGIHLDVQAGERLVLYGCSGAGKTTLLRLIAGLEKPNEGRVRISERDVTHIPPARRSVALVSQDAALYPQFSVQQNLQIAVKRLKLSRSEVDTRIANLLDRFRITHIAANLPSQISGGEAQRVAFARAVIGDPQVMLLDEPLSQLDGVHRESVVDLLDEISTEFGITTVMVSHDPLDAMRLADRIAVLHEGCLIDQGSPLQLYAQPKTRISGSLLSPFGMNWLDTQVVSIDQQAGQRGSKRYWGFRPEAAQFSMDAAAPEKNVRMEIQVASIRPLGFAQLVTGYHRGCRLLLLVRETEIREDYLTFDVAHEAICWVDQ